MPRMIISLVLLFLVLTACGPAGIIGTSETDLPGSPALNTAVPASYPYPEPVEPGIFSTGYPELLVTTPAGDLEEENMTASPAGSSTRSATTSGSGVSPTPPPGLSGLITAIARDLSAQADVPLDEIRFVAAEPMVWPNGGLGCPDPAMAYAEVIVEGLLIIMDAGNREFQYHTSGLDRFVLCRDGLPVSTGTVP
ncbi:MAG: hypothetical protein R6X18_03450 [Chloroflexota bacterium]|jgi:hypothetical protein